MQENEWIYRIALTQVVGIGAVQAKQLVAYFGSAEAIFKASKRELSCVEGIGSLRASSIKAHHNFDDATTELDFCTKYNIQPLFITDPQYPQRLLHCYDAPTVLYYRGNADLNATKVISIIGTRNNTDYGKQITEQLIQQLQPLQPVIVSGLAFGIDAIAHKAALQAGVPTIGVLAHGLHTIYPNQHASMAKEMVLNGGLITEFGVNVKPDKHNFPKRNRIVAGMADCTIVVETAARGGSMITAELAYNYNRDLFAVSGRVTDAKSSGCIKLVQQNKATLLTDASFLLETMGWKPKQTAQPLQRSLFIEMSEDEKVMVALLQNRDAVAIDEIYVKSGLSSSNVAAAILGLELQGVVIGLPGKRYRLA